MAKNKAHQLPYLGLIIINIAKQTLSFFGLTDPNDDSSRTQAFTLKRTFSISTAKNGSGNLEGSGGTPLGWHYIATKIGTAAPMNTVFVGRVATGEIYSNALGELYPKRDWILTRIMWLAGLEAGVNLGNNSLGCCDTYQRYIYIHGTPDAEPMGVPKSHGCIRMHNDDLVWLFDQVEVGTKVQIIEQ